MSDFHHDWLQNLRNKSLSIETINPGFYDAASIKWDILRADLIHPVCSGNKFFKLQYYLQEAIQQNHTMIHTWGGPWSNHIVATAYAARELGLSSLGLIHGMEPKAYSAMLLEARSYGMKLLFTGWSSAPTEPIIPSHSYPIPEGGLGEKGALGAARLLSHAIADTYTHILCSVGTGTMLAGLLQSDTVAQKIGIVISTDHRLNQSIKGLSPDKSFTLNYDFHFGGYARKNSTLLDFMNRFYQATGIPTDFVYTGKLMFAIHNLIRQQAFPKGSRLLAIHSGGVQGNRSLPSGQLLF